MASKLFVGAGGCALKLSLTDAAKTRDRTTTLYRCTNEKGERLNVQFGKGLASLVPARVISFANRRDPAKTDRMVMVNAESNKAIASDLEDIMESVSKALYEGRNMFWSNKPVADLSYEEFVAGAGKIVKLNNLNGERQIGVKTRAGNKIHPATRFFKLDKDAESQKFTTRRVAQFEGSGRNYEAILACHLDVYTNYQQSRPTFGIFLTATDCYLKDPKDGIVGAATIAEADCVEFDDVDELEELEETVVLTSTGDDVTSSDMGGKRSASAEGFTPSKRQMRAV